MSKLESLCKALRCVGSQDCVGDCYKERHNGRCESGESCKPKVVCNLNPPEGWETCPYYQDDYGVCAEDGELGWLSEVADILEKHKAVIE